MDDVVGDGTQESGDLEGQVNAYLYWETESIVDENNIFSITSKLMDEASKESCTVDITPRRLQNFIVNSGDEINYKNIDVLTGETLEEGTVIVDEYNLITIENQVVSKTGNVLKLYR